jgi:pyruvate/2-oxoglutarate/acetoin dehydrogenase E1 component
MIDLKEATKHLKTDNQFFPPLNNTKVESEPAPKKISYKDAVVQGMNEISEKNAIFIGYNVVRGDAMGTLKDVPLDQKLETPVAENLMMGLAMGMSFEGFLPVVYFERQDFMMVAMDALVNHLDKIERISHGEYKVPVVVRAVVAFGGPFYSGPTHHQDFTGGLKELLDMPVLDPKDGEEMITAIRDSVSSGRPAVIVERKSLY